MPVFHSASRRATPVRGHTWSIEVPNHHHQHHVVVVVASVGECGMRIRLIKHAPHALMVATVEFPMGDSVLHACSCGSACTYLRLQPPEAVAS